MLSTQGFCQLSLARVHAQNACMHSDVVQPRCSLTPKAHTANAQPSVRLHLSPKRLLLRFRKRIARRSSLRHELHVVCSRRQRRIQRPQI